MSCFHSEYVVMMRVLLVATGGSHYQIYVTLLYYNEELNN